MCGSGGGGGGGGSTYYVSAMVAIRRAPSMRPRSFSCLVLIERVVHVRLLPQLSAGWLAAWYLRHVYGRSKDPKEAPWAPLLKKGGKFRTFCNLCRLGPKSYKKPVLFRPRMPRSTRYCLGTAGSKQTPIHGRYVAHSGSMCMVASYKNGWCYGAAFWPKTNLWVSQHVRQRTV